MAEKKQPHNWTIVKPGEIISFRYKSKSGKVRVQTILVLNPRLRVTLKDGTKTKHLIGIKLEENNKIKLRLTSKQIQMLDKIGEFVPLDEANGLYKLNIDERLVLNDIKGAKSRVYQILKRSIGIRGQYRTYDFFKAKRSAVYLEPVRIFTKLDTKTEVPNEEEPVIEAPTPPDKEKKIVEKPKKPKQSKKPKEVKDED